MKTLALAIAAAVTLSLAAISAPASAASPARSAQTTTAAPITDFSAQRHMERRRSYHRGPRCTVRKVVTRTPYGRRVVRTTRVCR
ncbi:hypothetical protein FLL57_06655 [Rhodopseudomonas palustris]|nr:hypothetical protein FLL57_06655 [Rhodopseudomonas palustris]